MCPDDPLNPPLPQPEASSDDTIAGNRVVPVVGVTAVPRAPTGFRITPSKIKRKEVRLVDKEQHAELLKALREYAARGAKAVEDFGKNAPKTEKAGALAERLAAVQQTLAATELFRAYLLEVEDIALSDGLILLEKVDTLFEANVGTDPNLVLDYAATKTLFEMRSSKISDGIAQAKENEDANPSGTNPTNSPKK